MRVILKEDWVKIPDGKLALLLLVGNCNPNLDLWLFRCESDCES